MGGNGVGWRASMNGNLMKVIEKGVEELKGESDNKGNGWWLFLMCVYIYIYNFIFATC